MAAEEEEVQPGDSRGLEGSSAGAGETVCPCSPSVSFSSSVDMRVLSPLRELVSTWGQRGTGFAMDGHGCIPLLFLTKAQETPEEETALARVTRYTVATVISPNQPKDGYNSPLPGPSD